MFNNDLFSDEKFAVQKAAQGESESKQLSDSCSQVCAVD